MASATQHEWFSQRQETWCQSYNRGQKLKCEPCLRSKHRADIQYTLLVCHKCANCFSLSRHQLPLFLSYILPSTDTHTPCHRMVLLSPETFRSHYCTIVLGELRVSKSAARKRLTIMSFLLPAKNRRQHDFVKWGLCFQSHMEEAEVIIPP